MGLSHDELPLPDYDHLPLPSLRDRIRSLDEDALRTLIAYEQEHAHRLPVLEVLNARLEQLETGARPSEGHPYELKPEQPPPPAGRTAASPAHAAPPAQPHPHGAAAEPARKADRVRDMG